MVPPPPPAPAQPARTSAPAVSAAGIAPRTIPRRVAGFRVVLGVSVIARPFVVVRPASRVVIARPAARHML
ncbi:hypothetical protein GCM10009751_25910 [Myceligenerans crystallogenes]|uniref:Uncharacterized protein n=1 Tax=Myceligenerans crystallogenes TaxID=316335 RepID=A0ABP4ZPG0_9MICO